MIVYEPDGNSRAVPIIHRARFWVDNEENWYDRADESIVAADSCSELRNCPAPHAGFITKGDNNRSNNYYDQSAGLSEPVKPGWVRGTAEYRVPFAGWVRLVISGRPPWRAPAARRSAASARWARRSRLLGVQRVDDHREPDRGERALGQHGEIALQVQQHVDPPASSEPSVTNPNPIVNDRSAGELVRRHAFAAKYVTAPPSASVSVFSATTTS